ncbi:type II toxin-antitoxin system HicB family antitoxin [Candidatus Roizmanbacteria bacterium]|nr:type II toxin-antitoxin system HicB family antitoxin [Candidatus Roizmanbacteria bacterium]
MAKKSLSIIVWQEGKWYIAKPVGIEVASQGQTKEEALQNLREAIELLLEDENIKLPTTFKNVQLTTMYA